MSETEPEPEHPEHFFYSAEVHELIKKLIQIEHDDFIDNQPLHDGDEG